MKYLCLVYHEEATVDALPASEYDAIMGEVLAFPLLLGALLWGGLALRDRRIRDLLTRQP